MDNGEGLLVEPPNAPSRDESIALVNSYPYWYHRIYLGRGVYTLHTRAFHEEVWDRVKVALPPDLRGASVLDVGCNAGYFSLQTKLRGAGRVLGIESEDRYFKQAEACRRIWNFDIEYRLMDAHRMHEINERFDLVIFAGVLYHLKNPLQVLEEVAQLCKDAVIVETEIIPEHPLNCVYVRQGPLGRIRVTACRKGFMKFIEKDELNGDGSNWWVPDTECVLGMLRTAGFNFFSTPCYFTEGRMILAASKKSDSILDLKTIGLRRCKSAL